MNLFKTIVISTIFFWSLEGHAIVWGVPDCEDNATNTNCQHPNVVMISAFTSAGITIPGTRCTASLLDVTPDYAIFLTAAHCTGAWMVMAASTPGIQFGVSFDAEIIKDPNNLNLFTDAQFVLGAIPIINNLYDLPKLLGEIKNDFGAVVLPLQNGVAVPEGEEEEPVTVTNITPVTIPSIVDYVVPLIANGNTVPVIDVGYGNGLFPQEGQNGNANDGFSLEQFGMRAISGNGLLIGLVWGGLIKVEQHFNKDQSGGCSGDSGGPTFFVDNGVEVQIGIHSGGSAGCKNFSANTRTDVPVVQTFINCLKDATSIAGAVSCGVSINTSQRNVRICSKKTCD